MATGTLAAMKARIATELRRSDLTVQTADAINTAITAYEHERFYFNESRINTFPTVIGQDIYTVADSAFIGVITKIDYVLLYDGSALTVQLEPQLPDFMDDAAENNTALGTPIAYGWYQEQLRLYPIPDAIYTVRLAGTYAVSAPLTDGELNNFWMTKAERLIRSRAKQEMALHVLYDDKLAERMGAAATEAFEQLIDRTTAITKTGPGFIVPMDL